MSDRTPGEGRYAHVEREQRWIVAAIPAEAVRLCELLDRYIHGTRLRLRQVTDFSGTEGVTFKLGQKVRVAESDPEVVKLTNFYLSAAEYETLAALPAAVLSKTRWITAWGGARVAIDQFHGGLGGLVLAETELAPDADPVGLPDFARRDVTHDDRFSGGALANAVGADLAEILSEAAAPPPG